MTRAKSSGISLDDHDAAIVKGMLDRGDRQHDIASWFGVNGGRIGEISKGKTFTHVIAQPNNLPPRGPYLTGKASTAAKNALIDVRDQLKNVLNKNSLIDVHNQIKAMLNKVENEVKKLP